MTAFLIADTFTDSLARLNGDEQKAVKTTAFDLQMNPASPGLSFHKLDKARDKNFWSVRVNADIRIIVHRSDHSLLLCYVDHHDKAYYWAERRKLETHPKTGAAQLVEIREAVREIVVSAYTQAEPEPTAAPVRKAKPRGMLFADRGDDELLGYGVPAEWLDNVREADEDSLLALADHLPAEAAEALLELATGGKPAAAEVPPAVLPPFEHPDAQRRFRVVTSVEELEQALDAPWEKWAVFLHPEQRRWVKRDYAGPARVAGSAGTGKTVVAVHRAAHLARTNPDARVLLATFSEPLARLLEAKLRRLVGTEPRVAERVEVHALDALGMRLHQAQLGPVRYVTSEQMNGLLAEASALEGDGRFSGRFLLDEWEQVVDAWQLWSWDEYREVARLGRKTRLSEPKREALWRVFATVRERLKAIGLTTPAAVSTALARHMAETDRVAYDFAVVDEAQDLSVSQLRFFAVLGGAHPNALFFAGDLGQRIFQQPFSWKSLGVDVRGRSRTLRVNYRTSHQIREQADRLLGPEIVDVDGNVENRRETVSVFNGPPPVVCVCATADEETAAVAAWVKERLANGVQVHEIGMFVRSSEQFDRAQAAAKAAGVLSAVLDEHVEIKPGRVSLSTMHLAKGLEFKAVAVIACDDEVVPLQARIEAVGDDADLKEVYDTERHLLYVACTRARDFLHVSAVDPASEFLDDMRFES